MTPDPALVAFDALIQFVHADDSPRKAVLTGRAAARYKETIVRLAYLTQRRPGSGQALFGLRSCAGILPVGCASAASFRPSRRIWLGLKFSTRRSVMMIGSPVWGFRP